MVRFTWPLLLGLLLVACVRDQQPGATPATIDLANGPVQLEKGDTADRTVTVTEPSTVYVLQDERPRFILYWPHQRTGQVTVPVSKVSDGTGVLTIGVAPGRVTDSPDAMEPCIDCLQVPRYKCCPRKP